MPSFFRRSVSFMTQYLNEKILLGTAPRRFSKNCEIKLTEPKKKDFWQ